METKRKQIEALKRKADLWNQKNRDACDKNSLALMNAWLEYDQIPGEDEITTK